MIPILLSLILIFAPIARGAVNACIFTPVYIVILSICVICILRFFINNEIKLRKTPVDIAILLFLLISVISSLSSRYIYGSIMEIARFISLALIFYITVNFIIEKNHIKKILNLILITGTSVAIFGILQYLNIIAKPWWANPKFLSATYVNHNHFAGYLELLIPVSIGMILSEREARKKALYIVSFLALSIAFLLSMSRSGWLALSISMVFMAAVIFKKGKIRFVIFMSMLFFITLMVFALNTIDTHFLLERISSYKELDFSGRLEIWKGTLGIIKNNFIFGTGPGSFIYNFPRYRPAGLNMLVNYAHSDYLQVASEMGIFNLGIMIFIIFRIIKKGLRTHMIAHRSFKIWIPLSLTTGILSMAIHNIGDFNFYIPANVIIFTVFSAFIFNIFSAKEGEYKYLILKLNPMQHRFFKFVTLSIASLAIIFMGAIFAADACSLASDRAISRNDLKAGEALAYRASRLNPFDYVYPYKLADIYNKKAKTLSDNKFLKQAEAEYKRALFLNPIDSWSWIGLADTYSRLFKESPMDYKFNELAKSNYKRALDLDPLNSYYLKEFAKFYLNLENLEESSQMYKKASTVMSKSQSLAWMAERFIDGRSYRDLADMAFASQDIKKAFIFYKMAENFKEEDQEAKSGQVRCYMKMFLMRRALDKYREIGPSSKAKSILFASLGEYCLSKGLVESADNFSKKSIIACPNNPEGFQLKYKVSKQIRGHNDSLGEFKDILDFNSVSVSLNGVSEARLGISGKLNKEGSISQDVILPAGMYEFNVEAKGDKAQGVGPHIKVKFNGIDAMDAYVDSEDWRYYPGIIVVDYSLNRIEIIYDNDYYNPETKEDRNLYIDSVKLKVL